MHATKKTSRFLTFFPVPAFLRMPAVGFDISDHAIRVVEALPTPQGLRVGRFSSTILMKGIVENGIIMDMDAAVSEVRKIASAERLHFIHASLPAEQSYFFRYTLQSSDDSPEAIRSEIEFRLEEFIPIAPAEAVFDYTVLDTGKDGAREVSVATLPKKVVSSYAELFERAGLRPLSFEVESEAIGRAVLKPGDNGPVMVVDFGELKTSISIMSKGAVLFSTILDFGSSHLTNALQKTFSVSAQEAEKMKREHGFSAAEPNDKVTEALLSPISALRDEIRRHIEFWNTHGEGGGAPVHAVLLCGGGSNLRGLVGHLETLLKVPVAPANVWVNWFSFDQYIPAIPFDESLSYVTAIGLAMRG